MPILYSLIKKETLHIIRDRRTLLVVMVMPLILLMLFGFAISTEVNNIGVAVVSESHNDLTRVAIEKLRVNSYTTFLGLIPAADIDRTLRSGNADAVVVLKTDGENLSTQVIVDAANTIMAKADAAYIEGIITGSGKRPPVLLRTLYNPQLKSSYNFVPGILGMIFILICTIMTSVSIVSEKESGTIDLMLVSPVKPGVVIFGKLVPYFLLSCFLLFTMLTVSYTLLDIPCLGNLSAIVCVSLLYIALALSIGILVSTIVSTQTAALIVSALIFMIPVIMLSGMIFPIDNMPVPLQWISCIVPARWYISAMRKLMIQGLPLNLVATEITVLAGMMLAILAIAVKKVSSK